MDRVKKAAIITRLVDQLRSEGSWCGETHVQKAAYFLQDLLKVPLQQDFILYKHGPFSFDFRDELTSLRADEILTLELQRPYGPRITSTDRGAYIQSSCPNTLNKYGSSISFVAKKLGNKDVVDLERLATALFVTKGADDNATVEERADNVIRLKPHIPRDVAIESINELDRIVEEILPVE